MKFALIIFALIGYAVADVSHLSAGRRQVLDSATQGPNPQDIATPEPEYIDIDYPEPPRSSAPAPAPAPQAHAPAPHVHAPAPHVHAQVPVPIHAPATRYNAIPAPQEPAPAHTFNPRSGYNYKRPVTYYRRTYRTYRY